jgi:glycerol-3-phosphate dehydrogenase subunit B
VSELVRADVLVSGGGMAGAIAALAAAEEGARVVLVRRAPGASALSSGAIGVAPDVGAAPREPFRLRRGPLDAARRLALRHPDHPYALLGEGLEALDAALAFASRALAEVLAPFDGRARFLATPYGGLIECALCQRSMAPGDLAALGPGEGPVAAIGFRGHLGWDARLVAHGVTRAAPAGEPPAVWAEADLPARAEDAIARPHELARALEPAGAAEQAGERIRAAAPAGTRLALLPPVLGLDPRARVAERIAEAAGLAVAETVADPPSVPGLRLDAALAGALARAGVQVIHAALDGARGPGEPVRAGDREVLAGSWVLATGRFVGGGIVRRGALAEALLGLPVQASEGGASGFHLARRPAATLTVRERRAQQPLLAAGLRVDSLLRPLDLAGAPAHPRLFAAGAVIGGHEHADDGTGLGVAILTGWLAGRAAAARPV